MESDTVKDYRKKVHEASEFLKKGMDSPCSTALLTGTGLGDITRSMDISFTHDYHHIPHFPVSTVESHTGCLVFGALSGSRMIAMQGRFHLYEGYSPAEVTFPIRVMQTLGVKRIILLNAAGGLNPRFRAGDIMIISDHINLTGVNPLTGPNDERWGIRFPDMIRAYDPDLSALAETAGKESGIVLQKGVYAGLTGPSLETPAETRFLKTIGADAVGFSTVQETIAAVHGGMKVLGLSTITNINNPDHPEPTTVEAVISVATTAVPKIEAIIKGLMVKLGRFEG